MPLEVFYSYAHVDADEALRNELEKHLKLLRRSGHIVSWHDRRIGAGDDWRAQIDAHVRSAQIILLLISSDFVASDYCYDVEMALALERHARHEAIVIPIILRPVDWSSAPFAYLQALPRDAKAVTTWSNRDEAFANIAQGIREVVARFGSPAPATATGNVELVDKKVAKSRVLDAAIPSHIVKGEPTELQVLIRLPESVGLKGALLEDDEAEAKPEDVRSTKFGVSFPLGPDGKAEPLKVRVKLESPDFNPPNQAANLFVPPDEDSRILTFVLTPTRTGLLKVWIELQWEDASQGQRRLVTQCVAQAADVPNGADRHVVRIPLEVGAGKVMPSGSPANALKTADKTFQEDTAMLSGRLERPTEASGPANSSSSGEKTETFSIPAAPSASKEASRPDGRFGAPAQRQSAGPVSETVRPPSARPPRSDDTAEFRASAPPSPMATKASRRSSLTAIVTALIAAIPIVLGSYWQWVYKPAHPVDKMEQVTYSGQVLNARTKAFIPDARVTVSLEDGRAPSETFTDSRGSFTFDLGETRKGTLGKVYVRAENFGVLEKNLIVEKSAMHDEFRLEPVQYDHPPAGVR